MGGWGLAVEDKRKTQMLIFYIAYVEYKDIRCLTGSLGPCRCRFSKLLPPWKRCKPM